GSHRVADARDEQDPPGRDHPRDHRGRGGRAGAVVGRRREKRKRQDMSVAEAVASKVGRVVQVIGPVVDIEFEGGHLPSIYNAVRIVSDGEGAQKVDVVAEVEQHLGENRVRTVAMKRTDGMKRGMKAYDTGAPTSRPVGPATLGRVMNVLGEPVDFPDRPIEATERWSIHRPAPSLEDQSTELQMF